MIRKFVSFARIPVRIVLMVCLTNVRNVLLGICWGTTVGGSVPYRNILILILSNVNRASGLVSLAKASMFAKPARRLI